ncbi:MAG: low molecular weight protein arginine phosphatase [Opitutales bacterium]|nr:low molecular weight protein arginine phosphatase [Opitutales bacterium]
MGRKSRAKKERKEEKLVVFICTANVCRSPMAEKLFEEALTKSSSKQKISVFSAGISAMDGDKASDNSIIACDEVGLDLSDHRSAAITRATIENASVIFCMTESHRALLHMYFELPEDSPIFLMREFIKDGSKELPDPYGQDIDIYRECRNDMVEALPSLINWVEKNL